MSKRKTSTTAYTIAASLTKLAQQPRWQPYIPQETVRLNAAFMRYGADTFLKKIIGILPPAVGFAIMDTIFIPGLSHHYLFRKLLIEQEVRKAVLQGITQIVVLGGGLDTLAMRMAREYPEKFFCEVDLPYTQQTKKDALQQIGYSLTPNCIFVEADLSQTKLELVLRDLKSFDPRTPTLLILEGVLMYLTQEEVQTLLGDLRNLFSGPLTIIFGVTATSDEHGNWLVRLVNRILGRNHEAMKWYCASKDVRPFVESLGYTLRDWVTYKNLQRLYRSESEIKHVPEEDENYYIIEKRRT